LQVQAEQLLEVTSFFKTIEEVLFQTEPDDIESNSDKELFEQEDMDTIRPDFVQVKNETKIAKSTKHAGFNLNLTDLDSDEFEKF
jgi:hypothetical protein